MTYNGGIATICMWIAMVPVLAVLGTAFAGASLLWLLGVGIVAGFQGAGMMIDWVIATWWRPVTETAGDTRS